MLTENSSQHLKQPVYWYDAVHEFISWIFFSLYIFIGLFYNIFPLEIQNIGFI